MGSLVLMAACSVKCEVQLYLILVVVSIVVMSHSILCLVVCECPVVIELWMTKIDFFLIVFDK